MKQLRQHSDRGLAGSARKAPRIQASRRATTCVCSAANKALAVLQTFPSTYETAIRQAQLATQAALADGVSLLEIELPPTSLISVAGDGEGQNEMSRSMELMRQFLRAFEDQAATTRVFFPDQQELAVARSGTTEDASAGRKATAPQFPDNTFKFGYLTKQNALWAAIGLNLGQQFSPCDLIGPEDRMFVVAYPSFNPREELTAVEAIWQQKAEGRPMIIFNGELDRIRGGYYPALFFGELDRIGKTMLPKMEAAYYVKNFKGTRPAVLFRAYPGPWQVLLRNPADPEDTRVVWQGDERPSLKQVAMEIIPNARL